MSIIDLYSKRQRRIRGEVPDVTQYDDLPQALRVQIVHIWKDAFGDHTAYENGARNAYQFIHDALCCEYGMFKLQKYADDHFEGVGNFFLKTEDVEEAIDVVELSFRYIDQIVREHAYRYSGIKLSPDDAICIFRSNRPPIPELSGHPPQ